MYRHDPRDIAAAAEPGGRPNSLVIRGDLYSDTGYARATRALADVLSTRITRILGVSLHGHERRRQVSIGFPVVDDATLRERHDLDGAIVVNICLPDQFVRIPRACTVGYFFWETEAMPAARFWKAQMAMMDRIWAPSRWQSGYLRHVTGRAEIPVVPWPLAVGVPPACRGDAALSALRVHSPMSAAELDNHLVRYEGTANRTWEKQVERERHAEGRSARFDPLCSPSLGTLVAGGGDLFVAVQTDAARKGLPLLLAGWLRFKASDAGRHANLVIKSSGLDVGADLERAHFHASLAVRQATRRFGIADPAIWFVHDRLSDGEICALLHGADAVVTATMGEGFGGPIAEALIEGTPVIAPRHTAIRDLLEPNYPLIVASEPYCLDLWKNIDVYSPASTWHVIDDAALAAQLEHFVRMPQELRRDIAERARRHLLAHVGHDAVSRILDVELDRCAAIGNEPRRPIVQVS